MPHVEPAVPMSRLFAAFMEENNIRWGELVGGLLIVGCSVALVISLWSQIAGRPLLQFVLFNGVTAALFGVGIYTDRRWKIHTTSRGLLVSESPLRVGKSHSRSPQQLSLWFLQRIWQCGTSGRCRLCHARR